MANTFELISSVTVGVLGASSIDFTSIPSTYTDLCLKLSVRGSDLDIYTALTLNLNGSATGFTGKIIEGSGSGVASGNPTTGIGDPNGNTSTANTFGNVEIYIPNYASSNYKSISVDGVGENNATTAYAFLVATLWSNTAAINRVTVSPTAGKSWVQYTTAYLYGVKNA